MCRGTRQVAAEILKAEFISVGVLHFLSLWFQIKSSVKQCKCEVRGVYYLELGRFSHENNLFLFNISDRNGQQRLPLGLLSRPSACGV